MSPGRARGHDQEAVSRFLMRCVFTMFAADVRLLPEHSFRRMIEEVALLNPGEFVPAVGGAVVDHERR